METTLSWMLIAAAVAGFCITAASGCVLIPALRRLHFGQTIREEGPTWHSKKQGTPTMGGLCFILGILGALGLVYVSFRRHAPELLGLHQIQSVLLVLLLAFGSGLIGFLDDFIKVILHRNLGLTEWQKLVLQFALTFGFMAGLRSLGLMTTVLSLPGGAVVDLGWVYYPVAFFGIIFLVNAVNLTDGLDGLCTSVTFVSMLGYLLAASLLGFFHVSVVATATAGACAGFLVWNFYPAKVFMGDTGSMFFGGIVTALAFVMARPELVLFFGIVYIWDAMTVVIQRAYFKATHGKRIFRMTPIHHAFEMRGWREVRIDAFFSLIALMGAAMGVMYIYLL
ncbi:MAG: phospho-N-acetylmuramoyl-pentapeptide-transferase [Gemmiger sp.]